MEARTHTLSMEAEARSLLKKGDTLCSSRTTPMHSTTFRRMRDIYSKCCVILDKDEKKHTPLTLAAESGFANIVWGFLECVKGNDTKYHDLNFVGGLESFLGHKNRIGNTSLHIAVAYSRVDVVRELLLHASWEQLVSCKSANNQTPLFQLAFNSEYDEIIFTFLERLRSTGKTPRILLNTDDLQQQGSRSYESEQVAFFEFPESDEYKNRESLKKLDEEICAFSAGETILHHVVDMGDKEYAQAVIEKHPSLMYLANTRGEIPALVAGGEGQLDIFQMMLSYLKRKSTAKEIESWMIGKSSKESALHIAIVNHCPGTVYWLIKEVPGLINIVDGKKTSPLYIAAEKGYAAILKLLLANNANPDHIEPQGPLGTALHAAASKGSVACIQYLLKANNRLLYQRNTNDHIPLDVAVSNGHLSAVKELLKWDRTTVYDIRPNRSRDISTILIAAKNKHNEVLEFLISECPGCVDVTTEGGRNILHRVIELGNFKAVEFIFQQKSLERLINQKDGGGDTPMHLLVKKVKEDYRVTKFLADPRVDLNITNFHSMTPKDMVDSDEERLLLEEAIDREKSKIWSVNPLYNSEDAKYQLTMMNQIVLVAAFIATASFAAAFAIPGGFDSNEGSEKGTPILLKRFAYKAFVVANALAFTFSCSVFFENIKTLMVPYSQSMVVSNDLNLIIGRVFAMHMLTAMAMGAMVIAFVTGTYVVLTPSLGFAISICSTCLFILVSTSLFAAKIGGFVYKACYRSSWTEFLGRCLCLKRGVEV